MVTIEQYRRMCTEWAGDPAEFSWLVEHGDIAGASQRAIADEFEFAPSTVSRWAAGEALPHKRIQKLVVGGLEKRARRLEYAAASAIPPTRKTSGHGDPVPQG
ncbi:MULTISPECIES: hypothetical protein [unclassified Nitrosospira]|uniref:hypothetical protein n=1 Tax=unclassified Nitrosospira TaxID=2609267 RepID=UPI000D4A7883|nr:MULTISPECIES: hypothetical protein [unclassified Nitrosospira]PTR17681.1 hypothetical protein C8R31_101848 [Nitrosospira sp. Nsp2]WON74018.1 hypothetical protein R5L00_00575 [Nitrosospira sp. Is2]